MTKPSIVVIPANNNISLTVVRSLARAGYHVIAFASDAGVAPLSRHCHETVRLTGAPLADQLLAFVERRPGTFVVGLGELEIQALNLRREALAAHATLLFPSEAQFMLALDKPRTLEIARSVGVPVPRTVALADDPDLDRCRDLAFPVIVKPVRQDVFDFKSMRVERHEDLAAAVGPYASERHLLLVQEFCPGYGCGVEILMHHGEVALAFQHRRVREYPPTGGQSVCCESVPLDPVLYDHAVRLLVAMGWEGVAMVEYRVDPDRGAHQLMEVNGRFWGSIPVATKAGADFPAALVDLATSSAPRSRSGYREGLRCRNMAGDTKWLITSLYERKVSPLSAIGMYLGDFRPGVRYYVWEWDNPRPAIVTVGRRVGRRLERVWRTLVPADPARPS